MKVYLAGKISPFDGGNGHKGDWRKGIIDWPAAQTWDGHDLYTGGHQNEALHSRWPVRDAVFGTQVTGPYFIEGEGHDGQHGDSTHGYGEYGYTCPIDPTRGEVVVALCKSAIKDSDVVFCWLDDDTAYGTLWELGYASALGKKVVIAVAPHRKDLLTSHWFALTACARRANGATALDAYRDMVQQLAPHLLRGPEPEFGSPVEKQFWEAAQGVLEGLEAQFPVGNYRLDFALPEHKIGVEVDGLAFHNGQESFIKDRQRQRYIERQGFRVFRFAAKEVMQNANRCVSEVAEAVR